MITLPQTRKAIRLELGFLTGTEAANRLGINHKTFGASVANGHIPRPTHEIEGYTSLFYHVDDLPELKDARSKMRKPGRPKSL